MSELGALLRAHVALCPTCAACPRLAEHLERDGDLDPDQGPDWALVERMIGGPDYAVAFAVWPWPDGGWMAGVALMDRDYAEEQELPAKICALAEKDVAVEFNIFDGFEDGINVHDYDAGRAVAKLWEQVSA